MSKRSTEYKDFQGALYIDRTRLDEALEEQAAVFFKVAEQYALAVSRRDYAKDEMKRYYAKISLEIRQDNVDERRKPTEHAISDMVIVDPDYQETVNVYISSCEDVEMWSAMRDAFVQRGYILRELAGLYATEYYTQSATVKAKYDAKTVRAKYNKERMRKRREERRSTVRKRGKLKK